MISIEIPGFDDLRLRHLVCDYNGTLAVDGKLLSGVGDLLRQLATYLEVHVITADTFGFAASELDEIPASLVIAPPKSQAKFKLEFVQRLGTDGVVAIGNGRNDRKMLAAAALGIALIQREGGAVETMVNADVVATNVHDALELLNNPKRLIATLRS